MTVAEFADACRRRWRTVGAAALVGLFVSLLLLMLVSAQRQASITFYLVDQIPPNASSERLSTSLAVERVKSYTELLSSDRIAGDVSRTLGGVVGPEQVDSSISVESTPDTVVITATASDTSEQRAIEMANALGVSFVGLVDQLERSGGAPGAPQLVRVQVVQPASIVDVPTWQRPAVYVLLGLFFGLGVGVLAAVTVDRLDKTVRSEETLRALTGMPNLASIPSEDAGTAVAPQGHEGVAGEAYRKARTSLQFASVDSSTKIFLVTSGLAGEGKSTVTANLATMFAKSGAKTLVIEADLRKPGMSGYLGLPSEVGLSNLIVGQVQLRDAIQRHTSGGFDYLAAGIRPPNPSEMLGSARMAELLSHFGNEYQFVLVDTPPVLVVTDAIVLAPLVDGVLLAVRHGKSKRPDVERTIAALQEVNAPLTGTILTMVAQDATRRYDGDYYEAGSDAASMIFPGGPAGHDDVTEVLAEAPRPRPTPSPGMRNGNRDGASPRHGSLAHGRTRQ